MHEHHRLVQECLQDRVSALESQLQGARKQTCSSELNGAGPEADGSDDSIQSDIIEKDLKVPRCMASRIIGLKGSHIRYIKSKTGVRKISTLDVGLNTTVRLMGSFQSVKDAMDIIRRVVAGDFQAIGVRKVTNVTPYCVTFDRHPKGYKRISK